MALGVAQLLTERDASKILCLSVRTLQKWRLCGRGPRFLKLGHAVRYDRAELERFLGDARRASTSDPGSVRGASS
jgi:predicted DNA-binding transcriptional regulator AlpA